MEYCCVSEESSSIANRRLLAGKDEQTQPVASEAQRSLSRWAIQLLLKRCKRLLSGDTTGNNRSFSWRPQLRLGRRRGGILVRGKDEMKKNSNNKKKGGVGIHVGHCRLHLLRFLPSPRQAQVKSETVVPPGHIAVSVGPEQIRFLVPVAFLNSPLFQSLLAQSKEAFGYHHHGALSLPCHVADFQDTLARLSVSTASTASRYSGSATVQSKNRPISTPFYS